MLENPTMPVMKTSPEIIPLTFGALVVAAYSAEGKRRAKGIVRLAVNARLVEFCGPQRFVISEQ